MLDFSRVKNYYIACGYTDMRRQIDGLVSMVEIQFGRKPDKTSIFLFCGRRADRIKALYWDRTAGVSLAFLEHGEIEISNNQVENAIRPIVVGRKDRLFCDTQGGATAGTIIFTVPETAKANGLNTETYLKHLLTVLPERFSQNTKVAIDDLLPWAEAMHRLFQV